MCRDEKQQAVLVGTYTGELAWVGEDGLVKGETQKLEGKITHLLEIPDSKKGAVCVGTHAGVLARVALDGTLLAPLAQVDGSISAVACAPGGTSLGEGAPIAVGTQKGILSWVGG